MNEENQVLSNEQPVASQPPVIDQQPPAVSDPLQNQQTPGDVRNGLSRKKIGIYVALLVLVLIFISFIALEGFKAQSEKPKISPTPVVTMTPTPTIEQETTIILKKDQEMEIPNTTISAVLKESFPSEKSCRDCTSGAKIEILTKTGESKTLIYSCGGFSGECTDSLDAFGNTIVLLDEIDLNTVEIKIKH
jgi:hypothetical protein